MSKGRELLDFFKRMETPGIPEDFSSEQLDWVWEMDRGEFLEWLVSHIRPETHLLTEEEAQYRGPVLSGPTLQEAIHNLPDDEDISDQELREEISRLESEFLAVQKIESELLDYNDCYDEMTSDLSQEASSIKNKMNRFEKNCDIKVSEASKEYYTELDSLVKEIEAIRNMSEIKPFKSLLISECGVEEFKNEDEKFNRLIDEFIEKQFKTGIEAKDVTEHVCYDLVVGRSEAEFEDLVAEISRLRLGLKTEEKQKVLSAARLFSEKEALHYLSKYSIGEDASKSSSTLVQTSQEFYDKISNQLEVELLNASEKILNPVLDEFVAHHCRQILNLDCQIKLYRQKYTLDRHNALKDILLEQFSLHEMFITLLKNEFHGFANIGKELKNIKNHHENVLSQLTDIKDNTKSIKEVLSNMESGTEVTPEADITLSALGSILDSNERKSHFTYNTLLLSLSQLVSSHTTNLVDYISSCEENDRLMDQSLLGLKSLYKTLNLNSEPFLSLINEEYVSVSSKLHVRMKEMESSFTKFTKELDRKQNALKSDPHVSVQKKLWVNFLNNPKLIEINVNALINKIKKL